MGNKNNGPQECPIKDLHIEVQNFTVKTDP